MSITNISHILQSMIVPIIFMENYQNLVQLDNVYNIQDLLH